MTHGPASQTFRNLPTAEKQRLFLDVLRTPPFTNKGTWGERFHAWLEEQAAEGRTLLEIARGMELPYRASRDEAGGGTGSWQCLEGYVIWMIDRGFARVVRIEIIDTGAEVEPSPSDDEAATRKRGA